VTAEGRITLSIHAFVVEAAGKRIVVDTCVGDLKSRPMFPDWDMKQGTFLQDLAEAGFPRESIDTVLCTHLHVDHVGWNTFKQGDRWVPTFPNARYLVAKPEWEYWRNEDDPFGSQVLEDSVKPIFDAGLVDLVDCDHKLCDGVRLEPTPGHTPGHVSVLISSDGVDAVITGDLLHHPVQCAHPDWKDSFDVDDELAHRSRTAFLKRHAEAGSLVLGTHFPAPTAGRLRPDGAAYRFEV
jgi:glyoxylase-like metal-dependent hydrolase (beta-lactamase superfamily II)